jgi:transcriptional regulator with XRE-family HTH domain
VAAENYGAWLRRVLDSEAFRGNQSHLASVLGVTQGYISKVVNGEERDPALSTLDTLASHLGRKTWQLVRDIEVTPILLAEPEEKEDPSL